MRGAARGVLHQRQISAETTAAGPAADAAAAFVAGRPRLLQRLDLQDRNFQTIQRRSQPRHHRLVDDQGAAAAGAQRPRVGPNVLGQRARRGRRRERRRREPRPLRPQQGHVELRAGRQEQADILAAAEPRPLQRRRAAPHPVQELRIAHVLPAIHEAQAVVRPARGHFFQALVEALVQCRPRRLAGARFRRAHLAFRSSRTKSLSSAVREVVAASAVRSTTRIRCSYASVWS